MKMYARLVLTLAALLVTGPPPRAAEPTPDQQKALTEIRQRGGNVLLDNTDTTVRVVEVNLDCSQAVTDATLSHLAVLTDLQVLRLSFTDVTDAGLVHLKGLTRLRVVTLEYTRVTSRGAAELSKALPKVQVSYTPKPRATLEKGGERYIMGTALSPDGKVLALAQGGILDKIKVIRLWDVTSGRARATIEVSGLIVSAAFSPDGKTLALAMLVELASDKPRRAVKLLDVASGKVKATLEGSDDVWPVVSADGKTWAFAGAFSPDGKTLALPVGDNAGGKVKLWDVTNGKETAILGGHALPVSLVAFSPDGKTLASGSHDKTIKLWDVTSGKVKATLTGHTQNISSVAFSPDGKTLASSSCDASSPAGGEVKLWEVAGGKEIATLDCGPAVFIPGGRGLKAASRVRALVFSPDGKTLVAADEDGTVKLWDVASGVNSVTLSGVDAVSVVLSPDGKTLVAASEGGTVKLWDVPVADHADK